MIIYVHGLYSTGRSEKAQIIRDAFSKEQIETPTLPIEPNAAIALLSGIIRKNNKPVLLIGFSFGSFYATYLASMYELCSVLINPLTEPWKIIPELEPTYPVEYRKQLVVINKKQELVELISKITYVYLSANDEVLDYKKAAEKYKYTNLEIIKDGDHRFVSEFKKLIPKIRDINNLAVDLTKRCLDDGDKLLF